ncbi:hypothetical protein CBS63078_8243 [Aspergillus niger]|nr:hypothetical protein CBS63078_8243 [Aspergillus niger]KAI2951873.1 hypothetical protein CBS147323_10437 [Aspergillus niger]KAI3023497.1 hypothetical protein CBS147347_6887 [Aspergillus niger]
MSGGQRGESIIPSLSAVRCKLALGSRLSRLSPESALVLLQGSLSAVCGLGCTEESNGRLSLLLGCVGSLGNVGCAVIESGAARQDAEGCDANCWAIDQHDYSPL